MKNNTQNETKRTTAPVMIPVDKLQAFDGHPYKVLDDDSMNELTASIQDSGILQPLTVRPLEGNLGQIRDHFGTPSFSCGAEGRGERNPCLYSPRQP